MGYGVFLILVYAIGLAYGISDWTHLICLYAILPGIYFITAKEVGMTILRLSPITRNHPLVIENSPRLNDLFQRVVRATYASYIAVIGIREVILGWNYDDMWTQTTKSSEYHMYGLALFYTYDTFVLLSSDMLKLTTKPDIAMYFHHLTLIICYIAARLTGYYTYICIHGMVMEILVPFGVFLHWFKAFDVTGIFPTIISIGGFLMIVGVRVPVLLRAMCLSLANMNHPSFNAIPIFCHICWVFAFCVGMTLEYIWGGLYLQNIRRNLQSFKQKQK